MAEHIQQQERLTEKLQLLAHFFYSDLDLPRNNRHLRSVEVKRDFRLLDTIAVALTTGNPGDVYAAAFEKTAHVSLVLAKNGLLLQKDVEAAETFVALLSAATSARGLYPFLFNRCKFKIQKRIDNVYHTIKSFLEPMDVVLAEYQPQSLLEELPQFDPLPPLPTTQVIRKLFYTILKECKRVELSNGNLETVTIRFSFLCAAAFTASKSRFLDSICADQNRLHNERKLLAEKLKRRLMKLVQYDHGINVLISRGQRFRGSQVDVRWVHQIPDLEEPAIETDGYVEAIRHNLHPNTKVTNEQIQSAVALSNPALMENWNPIVHTCVHAEIRIILDFLQKTLASGVSTESTEQQSIGCSKRSCFACTLWIEAYNNTFRTKWMTSGSHGKPYAGWTLPHISKLADDFQTVNRDFIKQVSARVHDILEWLLPNYLKRASDEHYSSDSLEDDEGVPVTFAMESMAQSYLLMESEESSTIG